MRRLMTLGAVLILPAVACLVNFSPDGQPCAPDGGCLTSPIRYVCLEGVCHQAVGPGSSGASTGRSSGSSGASTSRASSSSGTSSGSASGSSSSGSLGCSPGCPGTELCLETTHTCVARTCANLLCPFLEVCGSPDGGAQCLPRPDAGPAATNTPCASDTDCHLPYFCLHPLHPVGLGAPSGLCTRLCSQSTACSGSDVCDTNFPPGRGAFTGLCLSSPGPTPCTSDTACRNEGLACTYFDSASQPDLPVAFCDAADGGALGHACSLASDCQSGLCAGPSDAGACLAPCQTNQDCTSGEACELVTPHGASGNGHACVPGAATRCLHCTTAATCGVDAPICDPGSSACNLACVPGEDAPCGVNTSCGPEGLCSFDAGICR
jgi:hypothetical protein